MEGGSCSSVSTVCIEVVSPTFTDTWVDAFSVSPDTIVVCLSSYTYNTRTYRTVSQEYGCSETGSAALTFTSDFSVTLADTSVTVFKYTCGPRRCTAAGSRTVTRSRLD